MIKDYFDDNTLSRHEQPLSNGVVESSSLDNIKLFNDVYCVNSFHVKQLFCMQKDVYYENDNSDATIM